MNRNYGLGPLGNCICPKCNYNVPHRRGIPCQEENCPKCGSKMIRQGSDHHELLRKKQQKTTNKKNTDDIL